MKQEAPPFRVGWLTEFNVKILSVINAVNFPIAITHSQVMDEIMDEIMDIKNFIETINIKNDELLLQLKDYMIETLDSPTTQKIIKDYIEPLKYKQFVKDFHSEKMAKIILELEKYIQNDKQKELLKLDIMFKIVDVIETKDFTYSDKKDLLNKLSTYSLKELETVKETLDNIDIKEIGKISNYTKELIKGNINNTNKIENNELNINNENVNENEVEEIDELER